MREILIHPVLHKFKDFDSFVEAFSLGAGDLVLTNEYIYDPFMKNSGLECQFVFQEKFGSGEPTEEMIESIFKSLPEESYSRVVAIGGGAIMYIGKLLYLQRTGSVH
ncbi:MAG: 4-hydroxybutyrate dehydrogenase, partial [Petrimonas sp.]|nr:4-hydroxybutyrate dehydrogenase [Petrimonas sp.]